MESKPNSIHIADRNYNSDGYISILIMAGNNGGGALFPEVRHWRWG